MGFPNPIKDELVARQPWILDAGFKIVSYHYSYRGLHTSDVELESEGFRVRFVRDRGTWVYAELAPPGEQFWGLTEIVQAVTGTLPQYDGTKLDALAVLFREDLDLLKRALGPDWPRTKSEMERRRQERLRELTAPRQLTPELKRKWRRIYVRRFFRRFGPVIAAAAGTALIFWIATR